eukprot:848396-Amphidinium_carterae.1
MTFNCPSTHLSRFHHANHQLNQVPQRTSPPSSPPPFEVPPSHVPFVNHSAASDEIMSIQGKGWANWPNEPTTLAYTLIWASAKLSLRELQHCPEEVAMEGPTWSCSETPRCT